MLLSARILKDVAGVNSFEYTNTVGEMTEGDSQTLYIQLIDASLDTPGQGFNPNGRRYVPASGATLSLVFGNIDDAKKVMRAATQPFPGDLSIWSVSILSTDKLRGTVSLSLTLTEGVKVTRGRIANALSVYTQSAV